MTERTVDARPLDGQPTPAAARVCEKSHTSDAGLPDDRPGEPIAGEGGEVPTPAAPAAREAYGDGLRLERIDILGAFDAARHVGGTAMLADLRLRKVDDDCPRGRALAELVDDQIGELAYPAGDLADVALKLAWGVRLSGGKSGSAQDNARTLLLGSALADVLLLRQGELVRRRRMACKAAEASRRKALSRRTPAGSVAS